MRNRFFAALAGLAVMASSAFAQDPDPERLQVIWDEAQARLNLQNDYWFDGGDFPRCIQTLRMAASLFPEDYEINTNLGWLLESTLEWEEALVTYKRFAKENEGDPDAPYPEANFYFMQKVYAKVPALLEPTLKNEQHPHPNSYRLLAHAYEKLGMLGDSARVWNIYIELAPEDKAAKLNLTRVEKKIKGEPTTPPPTR